MWKEIGPDGSGYKDVVWVAVMFRRRVRGRRVQVDGTKAEVFCALE